ncbi:LAFA_0G00298g1_1 [Lachancea sp. 'fantastica']|nr:LAFA_0G00298g1_1 [Lachancea sp. 'fantastica']
MDELNEVGQLLLIHTQKTLQLLDDCINTQRSRFDGRNRNDGNLGEFQSGLQCYYTYLGQLNSLYCKTLELGSRDADQEPSQAAVRELISDFEAATARLNAQTSSNQDHGLSPGSVASFEPRPLKIIQRKFQQHQQSPTKAKSGHSILPTGSRRLSDSSIISTKLRTYSGPILSEPGSASPRALVSEKTDMRVLRGAKSCDTGLNKQSNPHENRLSFFRDRQRLSISFFEDDEYSSDEETVISPSPAASPFLTESNFKKHSSELLRNLAFEKSPKARPHYHSETINAPSFSRLLPPRQPIVQCGITSIDYIPQFHGQVTTSNSHGSRALLAKYALSDPKKPKIARKLDDKQKTKFFGSFRAFNNQVLVTSETGLENSSEASTTKFIRQVRKPQEAVRPTYSSGSILVHGSSGSRFITPPCPAELHFKVSHDALREALNTDLNT